MRKRNDESTCTLEISVNYSVDAPDGKDSGL